MSEKKNVLDEGLDLFSSFLDAADKMLPEIPGDGETITDSPDTAESCYPFVWGLTNQHWHVFSTSEKALCGKSFSEIRSMGSLPRGYPIVCSECSNRLLLKSNGDDETPLLLKSR